MKTNKRVNMNFLLNKFNLSTFFSSAKNIICLFLILLFSVNVFSAPQESLSPLSKPIQGKKPEYVSGEVQPQIDGQQYSVDAARDEIQLNEASKVTQLNLNPANVDVKDSDKDENPSLRVDTLDFTNVADRLPLFRWFLLDKADPANGPRESITLTGMEGTRFVDIAPGRKIALQVNAKLIPFTFTGFPKEGDAVEQRTEWVFNIPTRTPSILSDDFVNPVNSPFPVNGFKNGFFFLITPYLAQDYDFTVTNAANQPVADVINVSLDGGIAKVTLLKQPTITPGTFPQFTIKATPKAGLEVTHIPVEHTFTMEHWLIYGADVLNGKPMPVNIADGIAACRDAGYGLPPARYLAQSSNQGLFSSRSLTGNLWNEWGNIQNVSSEPWVLNGTGEFEGYYFSSDTTIEALRVGVHLGNGLVKNAFPNVDMNLVCALNLDGSPLAVPQIRNFVLSGELLEGNTLIASYQFDTALNEVEDPQLTDNSRFSYGQKGATTTGTGSMKTLVTSGPQIYLAGDVKDYQASALLGTGVTEFKLPALQASQVGTVLEISVLPVNKVNIQGAVQTITTDADFSSGNQTYNRELVVSGKNFPLFEVEAENNTFKQNLSFPTTGFAGAQFELKLLGGLRVMNFDWEVLSGSEYASVDAAAKVTLNTMPADEKQEIIIRGKAKTNVYKPFFAFNKIRQGQGDIEVVYKFTLKQWYLTDPATSTQNLLQSQNFCKANNTDVINNFSIPSYKYQLIDMQSMDADTNTPSIIFNGKLLNEWGDLTQYTASNFKEVNYWVAEVGDVNNRNLNQRIGWNVASQSYTVTGLAQSPYLSTSSQVICGRNLDGSPFFGIPTVDTLKMAGAITEGSKLKVTYHFLANNGAELDGTNLAAIDFTTTAQLYDNSNPLDTVLETNQRTVTLVPSQVTFDVEQDRYIVEYTVGPLPSDVEDNVVAIALRPINNEDIAGYPIYVDSNMTEEEGNLTYRGFASITTPLNFARFNQGELESDQNFPTTGFIGALFRMNVADDPTVAGSNPKSAENQKYDWVIQLNSLSPEQATPAGLYFKLGTTGDEAGNVEIIAKPPVNTRAYIIATNKENPSIKRLYSFKIRQWWQPNFKSIDRFHSIETITVPHVYPIYQPGDGSELFENVFPTTGFVGAKFKLNIGVGGVLNNLYSWSATNEFGGPQAVISIDQTGIATLQKRPTNTQEIIIKATPQDPDKSEIEYRFKINKWFSADLAESGFTSVETVFDKQSYPIKQPRYGAPNDYSEVFPQTGFPGAMFRLNIGEGADLKNAKYFWTSSNPELVSVGNGLVANTPSGAGTVTLLKKPDQPTIITITAKPIKTEIDSDAELKYSFKLSKWFDTKLTNDLTQWWDVVTPYDYSFAYAVDVPGVQTLYVDKLFPIVQPLNDDYSNTFPTTGFPGATFMLRMNDPRVNMRYVKSGVFDTNTGRVRINTKYNWTSSHPEIASVGNDTTQIDNEASFYFNGGSSYEYASVKPETSGVVRLLKAPENDEVITITATPKPGDPSRTKVLEYKFKIKKWITADVPQPTQPPPSPFKLTYPFTLSPVGAPSQDADYSRTLPTVAYKGFKTQFRINNNTSGQRMPTRNEAFPNGMFDWSTSEDGKENPIVSISNSDTGPYGFGRERGIITFLRAPDGPTPITITARPKKPRVLSDGSLDMRQSFILPYPAIPEIKYTFMIQKWFETNFVQPPVTSFDSVSVGTKQVHPIVQPSGAPSTSADYAKTFPTIGFKNATFRINIRNQAGSDNVNYTWVSSDTTLASVSSRGEVTLLKQPDRQKVITITATPINGRTSSTVPLKYSFKVQKWFEQELLSPLVFHSITTPDSPLPNGAFIPVREPTDREQDFSQVFPQTGFINARFKLNIGDINGSLNSQYTWETDSPLLVELDEVNLGVVKLIAKPESPKVVRIIARPKDTSNGQVPLFYDFKLARWFDPVPPPVDSLSFISTPLVDTMSLFPINKPKGTDFSEVFPNTGFDKAMFRLHIGGVNSIKNDSYDWKVSNTTLASVGNTVGLDSKNRLSSGNVTLLKMPAANDAPIIVTATAKVPNAQGIKRELTYSFKVKRWFASNLLQKVRSFTQISFFKDQTKLPIILPVNGNYDQVFPKTAFNNARFRLDIKQNGQLINQEYTWESSQPSYVSVGQAVMDETINGAGNVNFITKPPKDTIITITARPKNASDTSRMPLQYSFKPSAWFRVNEPYSITGFRNIVPIDSVRGGSLIEPQTLIPIQAPDAQGKFDKVFPQTGFKNARFRLNIGYNGYRNIDYTWTSDSPAVKVGNTGLILNSSADSPGNVTLIDKPAGVVTIVATPKTPSPFNPALTYKFKLSKWFDAQTELVVNQFHSISNPYAPQQPAIPAITGKNGDFSQTYPQTGFDNARFRLNIGDLAATYNQYYTWSSSEDGKTNPIVSVGNGVLDSSKTGLGNVTLLRQPDVPTAVTITATLKPQYYTQFPRFKRELTYTFKLSRWFAANIDPVKLSSSFASLSTPKSGGTGTVTQPIGSNFNRVFPQTGFDGAVFKLYPTPSANNINYNWSSSDTNLVKVNDLGEVTLVKEPTQPTPIVITAEPKSSTDVKIYKYVFQVNKWVRLSPTEMLGHYQGAPNERWPATTGYIWLPSFGSDANSTPTTNPDLYCKAIGNGYRTPFLNEYTLNYPTYKPFVFTLVADLKPLITVGALSQEWGPLTFYGWPNGYYWVAEPATVSTRIAVNAGGYNARLDKAVNEAMLRTLCLREIK